MAHHKQSKKIKVHYIQTITAALPLRSFYLHPLKISSDYHISVQLVLNPQSHDLAETELYLLKH